MIEMQQKEDQKKKKNTTDSQFRFSFIVNISN